MITGVAFAAYQWAKHTVLVAVDMTAQ